MAKLRSINTGIWDDEWFCDLEDREQKLFLYFLTNRLTTMAGAYKIPRRVIRQDTGFMDADLDAILEKFKRDKKAKYQDGWIVLTNFLKNQSLNDNMKKGVLSDIADAPPWVALRVIKSIKASRTLSKAFESFQSLISDIETLSQTPLTLPKDEVEVEREDKVEDKEKEKETATPAPKKVPKTPKAIEAIREVCSKYPPKVGWDALIDVIGDEPDVERLTACFKAWSLKGNKPTNYAWVTAWYAEGIPDYATVATGKPHTNGGYDPKKDILSPEYEMPPARMTFEQAADYYFDHLDDGTREKYEGMKGNWLDCKSAKGHEHEIADYEQRSYKFKQRFSQAG